MARSKRIFLDGTKVHCIYKKMLTNAVVIGWCKGEAKYILQSKNAVFRIQPEKVEPGYYFYPGWVE